MRIAAPGRVPIDPLAEARLRWTAHTLRALPRMATKLPMKTHIAIMDIAEWEFERDKFDSKW